MVARARRFGTWVLVFGGLVPASRVDAGDEPAPTSLDEKSVARWLEILATGEDADRDRAASALAKAGTSVVAALVRMLDTGGARAGAWAAETLARLRSDGAPAVEALERGLLREGTDWPCAHALERIGPAGVPALVRGLAAPRDESRRASLSSLSKASPLPAELFAPVAKRLDDSDEGMRADAIFVIAASLAPASARRSVLAAHVADPSDSVRAAIARSIVAASGGEPGAVLPLALLCGDPAEHVRAAATEQLVRAVRREGEEDVVRMALVRALADVNAEVRGVAIREAVDRDLADPTLWSKVLVDPATEADAEPRAEIVRAWGRSPRGDADVRTRLESALGDESVFVRIAAATGLARRGFETERALDVLFGEEGIYHGDARVRDAVVRACAELGTAARETATARLVPILKDRAEEIRRSAEEALERVRAGATTK